MLCLLLAYYCSKYKSTSNNRHFCGIKELLIKELSWVVHMEMNAIMAWKNTCEIRILIKTVLQNFLSIVFSKIVLVCQEPPGQSGICQVSL